MKKKIISIIITMCMAISLIPTVVYADIYLPYGGRPPINVNVVNNSTDESSVTVIATLRIVNTSSGAITSEEIIYRRTETRPSVDVSNVNAFAEQMIASATAALNLRAQALCNSDPSYTIDTLSRSGGVNEFDERTYAMIGSGAERYMLVEGTYGKRAVYDIYMTVNYTPNHIHTPVAMPGATGHWYTCFVCHEWLYSEAHTEDSGTVTTEPTETTEGVKTYKCIKCGYVIRTEKILSTSTETFTDTLVAEAKTNGNTVTLSWEKIDGADKYIIYRYKNGEWVEAKTTTGLSATFKNLKNGKEYKYLVRYMKDGELSPESYSREFTVNTYYKPIAKATSTNSYIRLKWEEVPEAEKYAVYKYVNGKAYKLAEIETHAVRITKLKPDKEYSYIVRAYVDGKWTTMTKSDIVTIKTKAE